MIESLFDNKLQVSTMKKKEMKIISLKTSSSKWNEEWLWQLLDTALRLNPYSTKQHRDLALRFTYTEGVGLLYYGGFLVFTGGEWRGSC